MLLRKFSEKSGLQENLNDRKLVLDPDLIDLTMIPPPMTPDEVMLNLLHQIFEIISNERIYFDFIVQYLLKN